MSRVCTEAEMRAHVAAWPRPLERDVFAAFDPPLVTYNDFAFGVWPDSVVASYHAGDERGPAMGWRIHRELPEVRT